MLTAINFVVLGFVLFSCSFCMNHVSAQFMAPQSQQLEHHDEVICNRWSEGKLRSLIVDEHNNIQMRLNIQKQEETKKQEEETRQRLLKKNNESEETFRTVLFILFVATVVGMAILCMMGLRSTSTLSHKEMEEHQCCLSTLASCVTFLGLLFGFLLFVGILVKMNIRF